MNPYKTPSPETVLTNEQMRTKVLNGETNAGPLMVLAYRLRIHPILFAMLIIGAAVLTGGGIIWFFFGSR